MSQITAQQTTEEQPTDEATDGQLPEPPIVSKLESIQEVLRHLLHDVAVNSDHFLGELIESGALSSIPNIDIGLDIADDAKFSVDVDSAVTLRQPRIIFNVKVDDSEKQVTGDLV